MRVGVLVGALVGTVVGVLVATAPQVPEMSMSSMPTHSSLPVALMVMARTCTCGWLSAAAGRKTSTGVTCVAKLGPVVASATKPAGTLVKFPAAPRRKWSATCCTALSAEPSMSRTL